MKYENKLKIPIMMEEKKLRQVQETLQHLLKVKGDILKKIQNEENKLSEFQSLLTNKGEASSSFFAGYYDRLYVLKKEKELEELLVMIHSKNLEQQALKNKIEKMKEVSRLREKNHYDALERKEEKEVEELKGMLRNLNERGD